MTALVDILFPFARAWAAHAGFDVPSEELRSELERRLSRVAWWGRALAGAGAFFVRWLAPALLLGRIEPFESLGPDAKEEFLTALQGSRSFMLRGLWLAVKTPVAAAIYGRPEFLETLGYCIGASKDDRPPPCQAPRGSEVLGSRYDFIVVGSGAGGAAAAARLAEGGARVLVVEKGRVARPQPDALEAIRRYYAHGGMLAASGNCLLPIPVGVVLGGTTAVNSGTCLKTPEEALERWERSVPGFRAEEFNGFLEEAWRRFGARRAPEATASGSSKLFLRGLERLGAVGGRLLDRAEDGCVGSGRCCFVCPSGGKNTADKALLRPLSGSPGLAVEPGCELLSVEPPSRRGGPVAAALRGADGRRRRVSARALLLACGTLATPYFVRRFRLGDWRRAGDGLSVHPAAKIFALFDDPIRGWTGVPQGAGLADPGDPRLRYEGVFVPPELAALTVPVDGRRLREWVGNYERVATFGFMVRDSSRGSVRYPLGPGLPALRYWLGDGDLALMLRGARFLAKAFFAAGARRVLLPVNRGPNEFSSAGELEAADLSRLRAADLQMMAFHPLGTCGLGRVADADLKLRDGVYVADGSAVPESLGVNPQVTIAAFGLRLGAHLLAR